jgi:hypothetical protein
MRAAFLCLLLFATSASAQRPPAKGQPAQALHDDPSGGAKYVAALTEPVRRSLERDGYALLLQQSGKNGDGLLRAVIVFQRPRDEVFAVLTQPSQQKHYLPNVKKSEPVMPRIAEGEATDIEVAFLFTFKFRTQHWYYPETHRIEWALDTSKPGSLSGQSGYFQLYALDETTTIAEYGTRVQFKDGFVNFIRGLGERGGVADALVATRKHVHAAKVESGSAVQASP